MDAGAEECLVRVDVADACDALLREQEGLDRGGPPAGQQAERIRREVRIERLDAEARCEVLVARLRAEQDDARAEPARIREQDALAVR